MDYKELSEKLTAAMRLTGNALEREAETLIKEVVSEYDMNEIGCIFLGDLGADVESIYVDKGRLMLHLSSPEFEGDVTFVSLRDERMRNVLDLVKMEMLLQAEGPTIFTMLVGGHNVPYRIVQIPELGSEVKVTTMEVYGKYIKEGSEEDNMFYGYVPEREFKTLKDEAFQRYVHSVIS
jgi:hypothetical protein